MATVEFQGNTFTVDEDGFIEDFNAYNEAWVQYVKKEEGIEELTEEHWKVINVLQDYYKKNGIAPMVRILSKLTLKALIEYECIYPGDRDCSADAHNHDHDESKNHTIPKFRDFECVRKCGNHRRARKLLPTRIYAFF